MREDYDDKVDLPRVYAPVASLAKALGLEARPCPDEWHEAFGRMVSHGPDGDSCETCFCAGVVYVAPGTCPVGEKPPMELLPEGYRRGSGGG